MKRIVPRPTSHTSIVITTDPTECLKIACADVMSQLQELIRFDMEFLSVVFLLVVIEVVTED